MSEQGNLIQYEGVLKMLLYDVVDSIKRVVSNDKLGASAPVTPVSFYYDEITAIFRRFAEDAYIIGIDHAADALKREGFLTHSDIDAIKQITDDHTTRFWARIDKGIITKEQQYRALKFTDEQQPEGHLSNAWLVDSIASSVVFTAYNSAVKSKARKIVT